MPTTRLNLKLLRMNLVCPLKSQASWYRFPLAREWRQREIMSINLADYDELLATLLPHTR